MSERIRDERETVEDKERPPRGSPPFDDRFAEPATGRWHRPRLPGQAGALERQGTELYRAARAVRRSRRGDRGARRRSRGAGRGAGRHRLRHGAGCRGPVTARGVSAGSRLGTGARGGTVHRAGELREDGARRRSTQQPVAETPTLRISSRRSPVAWTNCCGRSRPMAWERTSLRGVACTRTNTTAPILRCR